MKIVLSIFLLAFITGCADTSQLTRTSSSLTLNPSDGIYISVPKDGGHGDKAYNGSGLLTTLAVMKAFSAYVTNVETAHEHQPFDNSLDHAKSNGFKYLVLPSILEWEDRATEWSGLPDRVLVKIAILDANTGKTIDSAIIEGKSGLATIGGDKPQDLLPKPLSDYVSMLYKQ